MSDETAGNGVRVFDPALACEIGLNETLILQQLHYWMVKALKGEAGEVDEQGRPWVYNSYPEWQRQFPFWSEDTVRRAFDALRKRGFVLVRQAERSLDRRNWYSLDYEAVRAAGIGAANGTLRWVQNAVTDDRRMQPPIVAECADGPSQNAAVQEGQNAAVHEGQNADVIPQTPTQTSTQTPESAAGAAGLPAASPTGSSGKKQRGNRASTVKTARPRDPIFDAIAAGSFGIGAGSSIGKQTGGRIARIRGELLVNLEADPPDAAELAAAYSWWRRVKKLDAPADGAKVTNMVTAYRNTRRRYESGYGSGNGEPGSGVETHGDDGISPRPGGDSGERAFFDEDNEGDADGLGLLAAGADDVPGRAASGGIAA